MHPPEFEQLRTRWRILRPVLKAVFGVWCVQAVFVVFYVQAVVEPACVRYAVQVGGAHQGLNWTGGRGGPSPHYLIGYCRYAPKDLSGRGNTDISKRVGLWTVLGPAVFLAVFVKPWAWVITALVAAFVVLWRDRHVENQAS